MPATVSQKYTAATTGVPTTATGQASLAAAGGVPFIRYAVQVKGVGGVTTSWSVTLEGSLDNANWSTLITHAANDGSTLWESTGKACLFVRVNVGSLTLGPASAITVTAIATS